MKYLQYITYALIIIGALNWGMIGLFNIDVVTSIFGPMTVLSRLIFTFVGIAGLTNLILELTVCKSPSRCYIS
jgi:uncharacterized membrane protein YuzA (DUF378 family)